MKIREILAVKGRDVLTIREESSVLEALRTLVEHDIGSLLVAERDRPTGIITERDILRFTARPADSRPGLDAARVGDVMTRELVTASPGDDLQAMMTVMTERRIRHLPVTEEGRLVGIISIGDLLNACRVVAEEENTHLRQYIQGARRP